MTELRTVADWQRALAAGATSVGLTTRLLELARGLENKRICVAFDDARALRDAEAADARRRRGESLSPLDGVAVTVKDAYDVEGWPTTYGTRFMRRVATADCEVVRRLRAAGAVIAAKVNLHEIGLGATGVNPHTGTPRNPWGDDRLPGGSSSGSGAAVAAGLGPLSVGGDAGGSIRIPAALCGVVGLKATYGRVPKSGTAELCWSLDHIGPLAASVADAELAYRLLAGPHDDDPSSLGLPPVEGDGDAPVRGLQLGVSRAWWELASADVRAACDETLKGLQSEGAEVVEVELAHLDLVRPTLYTIMGCEGAAAHEPLWKQHGGDYGADVQLLVGVGRRLPAVDYLKAQRIRTMIVAAFEAALDRCDLLVSPMTATVAPRRHPKAELAGEVDDRVTQQLTAFTFPANLSGNPSLSVPCGSGQEGLPVGLQLLGRAYEEARLLSVGRVVERVRPAFARAPAYRVDVLDGAASAQAARAG